MRGSRGGRDRRSFLLTGAAALLLFILVIAPAAAFAGSYAVSSIDLDPGQMLGTNPHVLGLNTTTKKLYVGNTNGVVSIYNVLTDTLITAIQAGGSSINDILVDSASNKVYLLNAWGFLVVIDGATDTVAASIVVGTSPERVAAHPTNGRVYVTNFGILGNEGNNTVSVVNASTNNVEATVTVGNNPRGIGILGNDVYVANSGSGSVSVIDADPLSPSFNTVVAAIPLRGETADWGATDVAVNVLTNTVYILNRGDDAFDVQTSFAVIDGATRTLADLGVGNRNPVLVPNTYWSSGIDVRESTNEVFVRNSSDINGAELHTFSSWNAATGSWVLTGPLEEIGGPITAWARNDGLDRLYLLANESVHVVNIISGTEPSKNHVIATLPIPFGAGSESGQAMALDVTASALYATGGDSTVSVFNLGNNSFRRWYFPGGGPLALAVDSTRNKIWVSHNGGGLDGNLEVRVIDGASRAVTSLDTGPGVGDFAGFVESTNWVYAVSDLMGGRGVGLVPINGETNAIAATIPNGYTISGTLNEATKRGYLASYGGTLTVVDLDPASGGFNSVVASVQLWGGWPGQIVVNEADNWIYVANADGFVSAVEGATNTAVASIPVDADTEHVAINQTTKRVYVSPPWWSSAGVRVIDADPARTATFNTIVATIPTPAISAPMAVNQSTNWIYGGLDGSSSIGVINGNTDTVETTIPIPGLGWVVSFAIDEGLGRVYVLDPHNSKMHVIDGNPTSFFFNTVLQTVEVGQWTESIDVNTVTHEVYTANFAENTVSVLFPVSDGSGTVSGRVTDETDAPLAGMQVIVSGDPCVSTSIIDSAMTDADGMYAISGLAPGQVYLQVRNAQFTAAYQWHAGVGDCSAATPVAVVSPGTTTIDFQVDVPSEAVTFTAALVFSENIQFDPTAFPAAQGQPYVNGTPYWRMVAAANVAGSPTDPVSLNSAVTGSRNLQYWGAWGSFPNLSFDLFNDFNHPTYGGPFPLPGAAWEDKSYAFSIGDARAYFYVPSDSLQQLPIPQNVSISGGAHPVVSWDAVPGADYYQVWILTLNASGYPDRCVFMSPGTTQPSYTYTGDLFAAGGSFVIRVIANQKHPYRGIDPMYAGAVINRSSFSTRHDTQVPTGTVTINGGAAATRSTAATLTLTATDAGGGALQMCVSDTTNCAAWTAFAATKSWTLPVVGGIKTVYVWFRNQTGTTSSAPHSDTILLDTTAPTNGTVTVTAGVTRQLTLSWGGFADPGGSGIAGYRPVFQAGGIPASCATGTPVPGYDGTSQNLVHAGLANGTVYGYRVCAIDAAGNGSSGATASAEAVGETTPQRYSLSSIELDPGKLLGAWPHTMAFNTATRKLYVGNANGVVSVFNGATDTLLATIRFRSGDVSEISDIVADSASNKVYVTDHDGSLVVIDGATDTIAARIPVGNAPQRIAVHATNGRVYVTNFGALQNAGNNTVSVVHASTNTVEATVTVGKNPLGIGINDAKVYVANEGDGTVSIIDANPASAQFNRVIATVVISSTSADWGPAEVSVNAVTDTIYVLNRGNIGAGVQSSFAVIDGATNTLKNLGGNRNPVLIPGTYWSTGLGVREVADAVIVRNSADVNGNELHTFSAWSAASRSWVLTGPVEGLGGPINASVRSEERKRAYFFANGTVHVVNIDGSGTDPEFNHVIASVPVGGEWEGTSGKFLALDEAAGLLYAAGGDTHTVAVIDLDDNTLRHTFYTGGGPTHLSVDSTRNVVWIGHAGGGLDGAHGMRRLDGATQAVTSLDTGLGSGMVALLNDATNWVYTLNWRFGSQGLVPVDGADGSVAPTVPFSLAGISDIGGNEDAGRLYLGFEDGRFSVVNVDPGSPGFHTVEATVQLGGHPEGIAVNEADNWIYVGNHEYVSAVNGDSNAVAAVIPAAWSSHNLAIDQATKRVYVSSDTTANPAVRVIDADPAHAATFNTVVAVIPIASGSGQILVNETTNRVYAVTLSPASIIVIDGTADSVEATIPLPGLDEEMSFAIDEALGRIYALDPEASKVHVIDGNPGSTFFNSILQTIDFGGHPTSIGVNTVTHQVYVTRLADNSVRVLTPHPLSFSGNSFTWEDAVGNPICAGSIGTAAGPYWPDDSYGIAAAQIADVDGDGLHEAVILGNHTSQYPGQVAVFDETCALQRRYWNPGHLSSLLLRDINADGTPEILVGGTNVDLSRHPAPVVFALDGTALAGEAPPRSGAIGSGTEIWYSLLDPKEASGIRRLNFNADTLICNTQPDGSGSEYLVRLADGTFLGTPATLRIAEAVDNTSLIYATNGSAGWMGQSLVFHDEGDAARSGAIAGSQSSWFETTVAGPFFGSFWWKVSSEDAYDFLRFFIDGSLAAEISGEVEWQQVSGRIETGGTHVLRWEYAKDASYAAGADAGWVDAAVVKPLPTGSIVIDGGASVANSPSVTLTLAASAGATEMQFNNDPASAWTDSEPYGTEKVWTLSPGDGTKTVFARFKDGAGTWSAPCSDTIALDTSALAEAVDNVALAFSTPPGAGWRGQASIFHDDGDAAESGAIADDETTWFETTVAGEAGSFWWKVSSEDHFDYLRFLVDGKLTCEISGEVGWRQEVWNAETAGSHVLRWEYVKDGLVAHGADRGWVDRVVVGTAPSGSIAIHGGDSSTNTTAVTLTLAASDTDAVTQMQFSDDPASGWSSPEPFGTTKAWVLPPGDGTKTVAARFKDASGLWSAPVSDTIVLDTTGPAGAVLIDGGAPGTDDVAVTLSLEAADVSGCAEMQISNDGVFDTEPGEECAPGRPWTLPAGDGAKTVFVRFKDNHGTWSDAFTDTIVLDTVPPSVAIDTPAHLSTVNRVRFVSGTGADANLCRVELQVFDGTMYLTAQSGWSEAPQWLTAEGTASWRYDTSHVVWATGSYFVTARAVDCAALSAEATAQFSFDMTDSAYTTLDLELSSQTILQNETITVSGSLTRLPMRSDVPLSGLAIGFTILDPDQESVPVAGTTTYDEAGHFVLGDVAGFTKKGTYTIQATFAGTPNLAESASETKAILVGESAGYAIIVEGKVSNGEGLPSHNKTANRVYQTLIGRGFVDDNIKYFNYTATQAGVDALPTKSAVQSAVEVWAAERMNAVAAPLYVVMVDHGNPQAFYLNSEIISPEDLHAWLNTLEGALNPSAQHEKRIVIDGSCYSGSFIPTLSKPGRIVITSAAADEQSYKGPNEPDNVRGGEFFVEELFKEIDKGYSLREAFVHATERTEIFTRRGGSGNSGGGFEDEAAQHPLLEDDGDLAGSNVLSDGAGDGLLAAATYCGVGSTNAVTNPAEFAAVTGELSLGASTTRTPLWGIVPANAEVSTAWIEIRPPSKVLAGSGGTGQLEVTIPKEFLMLKNGSRWECGLNGALADQNCTFVFTESGKYEVFYLTKRKATGEISSLKRSVVYKDRAGNLPPADFGLGAPGDAAESLTVLMLDWDDSVDPDGDPLTYTVLISRDSAFATVDFVRTEVPASNLAIGVEAGLLDLTTYFWKVLAVDAYGATTSSAVWSFATNNTNPALPGFVQGCVTDAVSRAAVRSPAVASSFGSVLVSGNCYTVTSSPGPVTITVSANGYRTSTVAATVPSGTATTANVSLTPIQFVLTVGKTGSGSGSVSGGGTYNSGTTVTVNAWPAADSIFSGWSGACTGANQSTTVVMNGNKTCTATFTVLGYPLSVTKPGNGSGTVTSVPAGIACGASCSQTLLDGTAVTLSAVPAVNSIFAGWGGECGGTGPCTVSMNGAKSVSARFMAKTQVLTLAKSGNGSGALTADKGVIAWQGNSGTGAYAYNTPVTLTATPAYGSYFNGWTGVCSGMEPTCTVTMNDAAAASAEFKLTIQELRVTVQGLGSGVVGVDKGVLVWNANVGTAQYEYGTEVTLQAQADAGSIFGGWGGAHAGSGSTAALVMDGRREVAAIFAPAGGSVVTVSGGALLVNGSPFTVKGVVYWPVPIGDDPGLAPPFGDYFTADYSSLYETDLELMRRMNANTVRPWMWNNAADHGDFLTKAYNGGTDPIHVIAGFWIGHGLDIDPLSPANVRAQLKAEFRAMVAANKHHPAILLWAIGNELNGAGMYGADPDSLFSLVNELAQEAHAEDPDHPAVMPLADGGLVATMTTHAAAVPALDLWGGISRGASFGTLFDDYRTAGITKPLVILEFGVDAYHAGAGGADEEIQADAAESLWQELSANSDICAGGAIAEYSDEWWRGRLADPGCADAAAHDICGSPAGAFPDGFNNLEWWGLMAVAPNPPGPDALTPRAVYGRLQSLFWSPEGALTINGGAAYTGSTLVSLAIKAPPEAVEMCVDTTGPCAAWEPVAASKSWELEAGDGEKTVNAWFRDASSNVSAVPASDSIVLDTGAPTNGIVAGTPGSAEIQLAWSGFADGGSGVRSFKVVFATGAAPASCAVGTTVYSGPAESFAHTGLTNTTYSYRVCALDRVGRLSSGATWSGKPLAESTPPTGSVAINGGAVVTKSTAVTLTLTASDPSVPLQMCVSNTATCTAWTAFAATKKWTLTAGNGTKTVSVWLRDAWGSATPTPYTDAISLDATAPVNGTVTATPGPGQIALVWPGFSDALSGVDRYRVVFAVGVAPLTCAAGTAVPGFDGTGAGYVHTGLINKTYAYRVCAVDKAGNVSTGATKSARPLAGEGIPPAGSIAINADASWTKSAAVTLALTASDDTPPLQMCVSNTATCTAWTPFAATKKWTLAAGNGTKTVRAWFRDTWGNATAPYTDTIGLDVTKPTNGAVTATPAPGAIALSWSGFGDAASGIGGYQVVYAAGVAPVSCATGSVVPGYDGTSTSVTHQGLINKIYAYRVCAVDKAGNVSAGAIKSAKPLPTEASPPDGSVLINAAAAWTKSAAVTLTLTASDDTPPLQMCVSNTATCTAWTPFAATKKWTLAAGNGTKMVRAWFRDTWGNATPVPAPFTDTIGLDATAPTNGVVTATPGPGEIALSWGGFSDAASGIGGYRVVYAVGIPPASCATGTVVPGYDGTSTSLLHEGLLNKVYGYRVCAIDGAGNLSTGATRSATPLVAP